MKNIILLLIITLVLTSCSTVSEETFNSTVDGLEITISNLDSNIDTLNEKIDELTIEVKATPTPTPSPSPTPEPTPTPEQKPTIDESAFIDAITNNGFIVDRIEIYDVESDPNGILGRPGQYIAKVNFRITSPTRGEDCTVEIFETVEDAIQREKYLDNIMKTIMLPGIKKYMYLHENYLLRLNFDILPDEAAVIEEAFIALINE